VSLLRPRRAETRSLEDPAVPVSAAEVVRVLDAGAATVAGPAVTEAGSLGLSAVWRAVNLIAGTCASLPLHAYRTVDDTRLPAGDRSPSARLLRAPHPDMTPLELWETVYCHLLLWGNAYLSVARDGSGVVRELWPLHPSRVRAGRTGVDRDDPSGSHRKVYEVDGSRAYTDAEVLHVPGLGYDGICGVSPIRVARQGLGLGLAAEEYGARLWANGSLMSGVLQTEQRLDQATADQLKTRWKARVAGLVNAHDVAVLDSGAKFQPMSIPPGDAQFVETRRFQVVEVARIFGVPPHLLMDVDRSTSWGSGIEQQAIGFVRFTLRPWLTRVEQRLTGLLRPAEVYARYALEGLLRGDTAARYASYATGRQWGWLSVNDVRRLEDMTPVAGGDAYMQPLNMTEVGAAPADAGGAQDPGEPEVDGA